MTQPFVAVLMGSDSDLPVVEACFKVLKQFDIPFEARVSSAHRTPQQTHDYVVDADSRGCAVFIAAAGMAAHLAGAVAANTVKPVIGIPIKYVDEWMSKYPSWKKFVMRSYDARMQEMIKTIDNIAFKKMDERLLDYLYERADAHDSQIINSTHQEIASDLNASREAVSRLLKQLEKKGVVTLERNQIRLL